MVVTFRWTNFFVRNEKYSHIYTWSSLKNMVCVCVCVDARVCVCVYLVLSTDRNFTAFVVKAYVSLIRLHCLAWIQLLYVCHPQWWPPRHWCLTRLVTLLTKNQRLVLKRTSDWMLKSKAQWKHVKQRRQISGSQ